RATRLGRGASPLLRKSVRRRVSLPRRGPRRRAGGITTVAARHSVEEEELLPRRPPRVGRRADASVVDDLDALDAAKPVDRGARLVLDLDRAGTAGVVRPHGGEVLERSPGAVLDQLARTPRRNLPRAELSEAFLHGDRRQPIAE